MKKTLRLALAAVTGFIAGGYGIALAATTLSTTSISTDILTTATGTASVPALAFTSDADTGFFTSGANTLNFATGGGERVRIDSSGNVGIGATTNLVQKLSVNGTIGTLSEGDIFSQYDGGSAVWYPIIARYWDANGSFPASTFIFGNGTGSKVGIEKPGSGDVAKFQVRATDSTFSGNMSIGNGTTIGETGIRLDIRKSVSGGLGPVLALQNRNAASGTAAAIMFGLDTGNVVDSSDVPNAEIRATHAGTGNRANLTFSTWDGSAFGERMRIQYDGNVGIGDTSPAALLTVGSGDLFQVNSSGLVFAPDGSAGSPSYTFTGDTNTGVFRVTTDTLGFSTAGSERVRISSSGRVAIATTTFGSADESWLVLGKFGAVEGGQIAFEPGSDASHWFFIDNFADGSANDFRVLEGTSGNSSTPRAFIQTGTNGWQTPSDARIKKNVATLTGVLDRLDKFRGVRYDLIGGNPGQIGVIAQELKEAFPELVNGTEETSYGVNYGALSAVAIQGLKELKEENTMLKSELCRMNSSYSWCE